MRYSSLIIIMVWSFSWLSAQDLTLKHCYKLAEEAYPKKEDRNRVDATTQLEIDQLKTEWLPKLTLNANVSWQNDVPHVALSSLPFEMPMAPKDQYKAYLEVNQILYDGGVISKQKELAKLQGEASAVKFEIGLQSLRSQVADLFFLVLMLKEQKGLITFKYVDVEERLKDMQEAVNAGVLLEVDRKKMLVEQLKLKQSVEEVEEGLSVALKVLSQLIGQDVLSAESLTSELFSTENIQECSRAEIQLFNVKQQQLDKSGELIKGSRRPKLMLFGQVGYGNPGFNMLMDEFDTFYMGGVKLQWRISDWGKSGKQRSVLKFQRQNVESELNTFSRSIDIARIKMIGEISKLEKLLMKDNEIISLRTEITNASRSSLKAGAITATDYLTVLNEESSAKLNYKLHELKLNKARSDFKLLMGVK